MKDFLTTRIVVQLILIGIAGGSVLYDCNNGISEEKHKVSRLRYQVVTTAIPLLMFVEDFECKKPTDTKQPEQE